MREQTYGWYPSAKNVYDERRMGALTPYQVEALYRYRDSKYYSEPVTPPERQTPTSAGRKSQVSRATSSHSSRKPHTAQSRVRSAPIRTTYKPPPVLNIPTPAQCWSTHVPETEIAVMPTQSPAPPTPHVTTERTITPKYESPAIPVELEVQPPHSGLAEKAAYEKVVRIQSAKTRRQSPSIPQRPVRSAGPTRPSPSPNQVPSHQIAWNYPEAPSPAHGAMTPEIRLASRASSARYSVPQSPAPQQREEPARRTTPVPSPMGRPPSGKKMQLRPNAPSPSKMEAHAQYDQYELEDERAETPDYNTEARKHGWMMEVHGDPLRLKKISKRLSYTVKVPEPDVEKDPPKIHMENLDTFFLNTIPRRPMAFAIDKEWISETIHKKRIELQAKHGLNYRYKNFSFVY